VNRSSLPLRRRLLCAAWAVLAFAGPQLRAQAVASNPTETSSSAPSAAAATPEEEKEIVQLSPFVVEASEDLDRYQATSTLAGTRVRTDLRDLASSISVVTLQFLKDTGAKNAQDLLVYAINAEVGGVQGNYAGVGNLPIGVEATDANNLKNPGGNTRIRGLDSADNTRDYIPTEIGWDAYNVGRIDLQRGPNSILFGLGSPAGIINASVNRATFRSGGIVETRFGSFGTKRASFDWNQVLLKDELAIRVDGLDDDTKYRQKPAYSRDQRLFITARWDPRLIRSESAHTSVRANFEHGKSKANQPRVLPPDDRITPFFDPQAINRQTWDGWYAIIAGIAGGNDAAPGVRKNPWLTTRTGAGTNPMFTYDSPAASTPSAVRQEIAGTYWGIGPDGARDGNIDGFGEYYNAAEIGIANFAEAALQSWNLYGDPRYPAADKGIWKTKVLTDPTIFDFFNQLLDGPGKKSSGKFDAYNLALEQTWFDNRLGLELVCDRQKNQSQNSARFGDPSISVDIKTNLTAWPWAYPDLVISNPNAGRAYVGGNLSGASSSSDRANTRATLFGELRASEFLGSSKLASILGRHLFTGLVSRQNYEVLERRWNGAMVDQGWLDAIGADPPHINSNLGLTTYLSGDLRDRTSASGLNLAGLTADQSPAGSYSIRYFDSHWKAPTVDPAAPWETPLFPGHLLTESENPRNYAGWVSGSFNVLNADQGSRDQLYTSASRTQQITDSRGLTWQGYLWDDTIVVTAGWRHDQQKQRVGSSSGLWSASPSGAANPNPDLQPLNPANDVTADNSATWGVVVHTPKALRNKLPWGSDLSFTYNEGRNARVENRYGFDGRPLPNAKGRTRDFGVVLSTLDERLQLKATWFKTTVKDANLSSVTTEITTLGYNTYLLKNLEAWGTTDALMDLAGLAGDANFGTSWAWFWDWAIADSGWQDYSLLDPHGSAFLNHPSTILEKKAIASWLEQMQPQSWFDAYGFPVDVAKAKAGDYAHAIANGAWQPSNYVGIVQPAGAQGVNGLWPTGTADNESKGVELELVGRPAKGWNIAINASKTKAVQAALGKTFVDFIEAQHAKFESPAGDLRLWYSGGEPLNTLRGQYDYYIWNIFQFQQQCNGRMVPEMAPWRVNLVTNYAFQKGALKGLNVGVGYRWEDGVVLGYALNAARDGLDVNRPFWGKPKDAVDLWAGYERKLGRKVGWRVQLNVRNLGRNPHLEPITVEPDGSPSVSRIAEGMTWQVTNIFLF
jgi:outer membrane receptor protein involved in Fe transport